MRALLRVLYGAAAGLASAIAAVVPQSSHKIALSLRARRGVLRRYRAWADGNRDRSRPLLWMHAPSVGEGLMARPVLNLMRERHADAQLAYTFFSPSAEEFSRGLDVDFRDYLPFDTVRATEAAVDALAPTALVFSKLDVWPTLVRKARERGVRVGMVSASLPPQSRRRRGIGRLILHEAYASLDAVGAVDEDTAVRLVELGVRPDVVVVTGDTRYDQVWQRAENADRSAGLLARLKSDRPTFIAGSTWPVDEVPVLAAVARVRRLVPALRLIIAPHEVSPGHLEGIEGWARQHALTLARLDDVDAVDADIILVDRYGVLGDLYALADIAYVGGGFHDAGLHSVLEPAAFGAPVLFGPRHDRSRDAVELQRHDGGRAVRNAAELEAILLEWNRQPPLREAAGRAAREVIDRGRGAAERSLKLVESLM